MNQFHETIFLKEDSTQEKKLNFIYQDKKNSYSIEDIYNLKTGLAGEKQLAYHLKKSTIGMYALRDINLQHDEQKAQIDFIVITSHHGYLIECKNYNADKIIVDETRNFELSTKYGKKYTRKGIKSPISQVEDQLSVLKMVCLANQEKVKELLKKTKFKDYFKTIVVFTNQNNRLELKKAPSDIKYRIIKVDNIIRQIEYDNKHYQGNRLSKDEMLNIANFILDNNLTISEEDIVMPEPLPIQPKKSKCKSNKNNILEEFKQGIIRIIIAILFLSVLACLLDISRKSKENNNASTNIKTSEQTKYPMDITDNTSKALSIMKSAYDDSAINGFTILHTSVCLEISDLFNGDLNCKMFPIEVSYKDNNTINIYKPSDKKCYTLTISSDNKQITDAKYSTVTDESCNGNPIGIVQWDNDNEYYQKIGGYEKIKELAIQVYKNGQFYIYNFDRSNISSRGGDATQYSTYYTYVNNYFLGVTNKNNNTIFYETTTDNFNKMVESYYYIMK